MNPEIGIVEAVSVLERGEVAHNGYQISIDGETHFVTGNSDDVYRVGDELELSIAEHPYEPLGALMITIMGVHR